MIVGVLEHLENIGEPSSMRPPFFTSMIVSRFPNMFAIWSARAYLYSQLLDSRAGSAPISSTPMYTPTRLLIAVFDA